MSTRQIDVERALQLRAEGKTQREIAEALGSTQSGVGKALRRSTGKITDLQQHKDTKKEQAAAAPVEQDEQGAAAFQVDVTPAAQESRRPSFLDLAKEKLGIETQKDVTPKVQSRRLTKGQQEFVDLALPIASELGKVGGAWTWEKFAKDYYHPVLAPDDEDAEKIMAPICRIMARLFSVKYKGKVTPNGMDAMAAGLAVVGYGLTSWQVYQAIKRENRYEPQEEDRVGTRTRAGAVRAERQTVESGASRIYAPGLEAEDDTPDGRGLRGRPPESGSVDIRSLSPAERQQYESLNRLRNLDYASRMRRSGRAS